VTRHDLSSGVVSVEVSGSLTVVIVVVELPSAHSAMAGARASGLIRACRVASSSPGTVSGRLLSIAWPGVLVACVAAKAGSRVPALVPRDGG